MILCHPERSPDHDRDGDEGSRDSSLATLNR